MTYQRNWKPDEVAEISIWEQKPEGNKPRYTGTLTMKDGTKYDVSLWDVNSTSTRAPIASGVVKEPYKPTNKGRPQNHELDDEPPF